MLFVVAVGAVIVDVAVVVVFVAVVARCTLCSFACPPNVIVHNLQILQNVL